MLKLNQSHLNLFKRQFSTTNSSLNRRAPKEEFNNNMFATRKRTADPFDRRWKWTAKSAEPYNVKGGHYSWTQNPMLHRGVQRPGYIDPKTKEFIFVEEMVPEVVVPDLTGFKLKPYVSYNTQEVKTPVFDARKLYKETLERDILLKIKNEVK